MRRSWLLLCFCLLLFGCSTTIRPGSSKKQPAPSIAPDAAKASIPRSPDPVVRVIYKRGRSLRYNVYNNSGQNFRGLVVIFEGVDCAGIRPRRLWAKVMRGSLKIGGMQVFRHNIPRYCRFVKVFAFDRVKFTQRLRKHKPFVRYKFIPDQRNISYQIYNRSILPFRGLAVVIRGKDCNGPKKNYVVELGYSAWLQPNFLRSYRRTMPYPCRTFRVFAFDYIEFKRLKLRMRQLYQRRKRFKNRFQSPPTQLQQPQEI